MKPAACSCRVSTSLIFERRSELQHVEILLAGNGEDVFDALVLKGGHQQIGGFGHATETPLAPVAAFSARCGSVHSGRMK